MYNIVICDDDSSMLKLIYMKIKAILSNQEEYNCIATTSIKKLKNCCIDITVHLAIIDIKMPEESGFDFAKWLKRYNKNILIIYISSIEMYVYESFKYFPYRFIRKSHLEELDEAIKSAINLIDDMEKKYIVQINTRLSFEVKINDIVYFESMHNNIKMVTINGEKIYRATLKNVTESLDSKDFIKINSGIYINMKYIYMINQQSSEVKLLYGKKEEILPVSRSNIKNLVDKYKVSLR